MVNPNESVFGLNNVGRAAPAHWSRAKMKHLVTGEFSSCDAKSKNVVIYIFLDNVEFANKLYFKADCFAPYF